MGFFIELIQKQVIRSSSLHKKSQTNEKTIFLWELHFDICGGEENDTYSISFNADRYQEPKFLS